MSPLVVTHFLAVCDRLLHSTASSWKIISGGGGHWQQNERRATTATLLIGQFTATGQLFPITQETRNGPQNDRTLNVDQTSEHAM